MTPDQARDLAARTLARINEHQGLLGTYPQVRYAADRKRVASDLAGIERHQHCGEARNGLWASTCIASDLCDDQAAFTAGLVRTADLYGEKP